MPQGCGKDRKRSGTHLVHSRCPVTSVRKALGMHGPLPNPLPSVRSTHPAQRRRAPAGLVLAGLSPCGIRGAACCRPWRNRAGGCGPGRAGRTSAEHLRRPDDRNASRLPASHRSVDRVSSRRRFAIRSEVAVDERSTRRTHPRTPAPKQPALVGRRRHSAAPEVEPAPSGSLGRGRTPKSHELRVGPVHGLSSPRGRTAIVETVRLSALYGRGHECVHRRRVGRGRHLAVRARSPS